MSDSQVLSDIIEPLNPILRNTYHIQTKYMNYRAYAAAAAALVAFLYVISSSSETSLDAIFVALILSAVSFFAVMAASWRFVFKREAKTEAYHSIDDKHFSNFTELAYSAYENNKILEISCYMIGSKNGAFTVSNINGRFDREHLKEFLSERKYGCSITFSLQNRKGDVLASQEVSDYNL